MNFYKQIEQKMKHVASKEATPAPSFVWDNIEDALNENERGRKGYFWLFLGGLLLIGTYVLFQKNTVVKENSNTVLTSEIAQTIETIDVKKSVISANENIEKEIIVSSESDVYVPVKALLEDDEIQKNTFKNKSIPKVEKTFVTSPEIVNNDFFTERTTSKKNLLKEKTPENFQERQVENLSKIALSDLDFLAIDLPKLDYNRNKISCPSFGGKTINLNPFIEINGVGGMHFKNLDGTANQSLSEARNQTEKMWYSYGGNVAVGLNLSSNLYLGAGIEWGQAVDEFYYSDDAVTQLIITFDPETSQPIDTSLVLGVLENKGDIRYTTIDIPVFIGFTKQFRTFELGLESGLLYNLSFQTEGKIINEQLDISKISEEQNIYKKELGLGLRTSLVFRKTMGNGLSFQVKPTFKMYLDDINHTDYILPTTLQFARLNIGLRKDF